MSLDRVSFDLACRPIKLVLLTQSFQLGKSLGLLFVGNGGSRDRGEFLWISGVWGGFDSHGVRLLYHIPDYLTIALESIIIQYLAIVQW